MFKSFDDVRKVLGKPIQVECTILGDDVYNYSGYVRRISLGSDGSMIMELGDFEDNMFEIKYIELKNILRYRLYNPGDWEVNGD